MRLQTHVRTRRQEGGGMRREDDFGDGQEEEAGGGRVRDDDFGDACQQKFQIQILELHVGFSIVDNTELRTRARARARPWSPARG